MSRVDVERLARAIEVIALRDRDRVLAGDYTASTYAEHAAALAREYEAAVDEERLPDFQPVEFALTHAEGVHGCTHGERLRAVIAALGRSEPEA